MVISNDDKDELRWCAMSYHAYVDFVKFSNASSVLKQLTFSSKNILPFFFRMPLKINAKSDIGLGLNIYYQTNYGVTSVYTRLGDIVVDEVVEFADSGITGGEECAAGGFNPGARTHCVPGAITETVQRGTTVTLQSTMLI